MSEPKEHWALERKVPLALLFAIGVQTAGFAWAAATLTARVDQLERQVAAAAPQAERLVRVETKTDGVIASLAEVKDILRNRHP
jgi:hypothetical protein